MRIKVGPHHYDVVEDPQEHLEQDVAEGSSTWGRTNHGTQTIHINTAIRLSVRQETTLHEALHALLFVSGLQDMFEEGKDEDFINAMSPYLLGLIRDNPELMDMLEAEEEDG